MIFLSLAVLVIVGALRVTVRALARQTEIERGELRLRPLSRATVQSSLSIASTVGANYQVGMWLPYFVRIGRPFIIITRTAPMLNQISELCNDLDVKCR